MLEQAHPRRFRFPLALLAAIAALWPAACNQRPSGEPPLSSPAEPDFAHQAEAVRRGQSEQIRLDETPVRDEDLRHLDGLQDKLRQINLSNTEISDAGLAQIARMRQLIQLRLASRRVTDAGVDCLRELKKLRHLHLIDAPLTDEGLKHLEALDHLESLYLDGARASDDGIQRLVDALPGVHLHFDGGHHRIDPHADVPASPQAAESDQRR